MRFAFSFGFVSCFSFVWWGCWFNSVTTRLLLYFYMSILLFSVIFLTFFTVLSLFLFDLEKKRFVYVLSLGLWYRLGFFDWSDAEPNVIYRCIPKVIWEKKIQNKTKEVMNKKSRRQNWDLIHIQWQQKKRPRTKAERQQKNVYLRDAMPMLKWYSITTVSPFGCVYLIGKWYCMVCCFLVVVVVLQYFLFIFFRLLRIDFSNNKWFFLLYIFSLHWFCL